MARILIAEDESDLASLLEYNLKAAGYDVDIAATGASALQKVRNQPFHLVLLDVMLPDISGTEVARMIRELPAPSSNVYIIMVTARGEEADRIRGLETGADDYVVKPFSVKELLLRIKAVLRRGEPPKESDATLSAGAIFLDDTRHEVSVSGCPVVLTSLEFRLLKTFLMRPGMVQTRDTLLADVWGIEAEITTRTVDTHIKRLREKLGKDGDIIETIRGVGYKLVLP